MENRVVLVTGASRGIGRAVAVAFGERGYRVAVHYREQEAAAQETARAVEKAGGRTLLLQGDVSKPEEVQKVFAHLRTQWGRLDVLINSAGMSRDRTILKMSAEDWDQVIRVNLNGAFYCLKEAAAIMQEQGSGVILNVGSFVGMQGAVGAANYAASKSGLIGLTKTAARELGRHRVCVNMVLPGFHTTDMNQHLPPKVVERAKELSVLNELPPLDKVSRFIAVIAEQTYISGQIFDLDGRIL